MTTIPNECPVAESDETSSDVLVACVSSAVPARQKTHVLRKTNHPTSFLIPPHQQTRQTWRGENTPVVENTHTQERSLPSHHPLIHTPPFLGLVNHVLTRCLLTPPSFEVVTCGERENLRKTQQPSQFVQSSLHCCLINDGWRGLGWTARGLQIALSFVTLVLQHDVRWFCVCTFC
jgi:hypothetical protein